MSKVVNEIITMLDTEHSSFHAANDKTIKGNGIVIEDLGNVAPPIIWFTSIAKVTIKGSRVNTTTKDLKNLEKAAKRWYAEAGISSYQ